MSYFEQPRQSQRKTVQFSEALEEAKRALPTHLRELPDQIEIGPHTILINDIARDLLRLQEQIYYGIPSLTVFLSLPDTEDYIEIPVDFELDVFNRDTRNVDTTINDLIASRARIGIADNAYSRKLFFDRATETTAMRAVSANLNPSSLNGSNNLEVRSNRSGDTIVYAKGYFYSTRTGLGTSTPVHSFLPVGRYDFGIMIAGTTLWNGIAYSIPAPTHILVARP